MAMDPVKFFLGIDEAEVDPAQVVGAAPPEAAPATEGLFDTFRAGIKTGAEGLGRDVEYFSALFNTLSGDDAQAAADVRNARVREEFSTAPLQGVETFAEFLEEPTVKGFFTQAAKGAGQVLPSAITSIAGAGVGGLAAAAGRSVLSKSARKSAEKVVRDSLERTARGVADPDEELLAQAVYTSFKRGAIGGAGFAEYVPLAGSNLSEGLESGQDLDTQTAVRAGLVAAPQAAVGVGGELAILKLIGNVASKRAVGEGTLFGRLASDISTATLRSGAVEGSTEFVQEGISVANRLDLDENYDFEDAQLRLAEAAFVGFFGGAGIGAAGGAGASVVSNRAEIASKASDKLAPVFDRAKGFLESARNQKIDQQVAEEAVSGGTAGQTSPEPMSYINAQLAAMVDPSSTKRAVWVAGEDPALGITTEVPARVDIDGTQAWAAFVPGRGTIVSTNQQIVNEVVASRASDEVVGVALGYSGSKPIGGATLAAQALDRNGNVVSEELTDESNAAAALNAARGFAPEGGSVRIVDAQQALEDRARKLAEERGPTIRSMDAEVDPITGDEVALDEDAVSEFEGDTQGEFTEEVLTTQEFAPRNTSRDAEGGFANTQETREAFVEAFGDEMDIDFNLPFYNRMSESLMRRAVELKRQNPDTFVAIRSNLQDGAIGNLGDSIASYEVSLVTTPDTRKIGGQPIFSFLADEIRRARRSKFASDRVQLVQTVDGQQQTTNVNLVDLVNTGKRLNAAIQDVNFEEGGPFQSARNGFLAIMSELADRGFDIRIDGRSIFTDPRPITESDVQAAVGPNNSAINLADLFSAEQEGTTSFVEAVDPAGNVLGSSQVTSDTPAQRVRQEQLNNQFIANLERRFPVLGVQLRRRIPNTNEELVLRESNQPDPIINESSVNTTYEVYRQDLSPDENSRTGTRLTERLVGRFSSEQQAQDFVSRNQQNPRQLGLFEQQQFGFESAPSFEIRRTDSVTESTQPISEQERFTQNIENNPGDGLPLTRLNIEDNPRFQPRGRAGTPGRASTFREATYPAGSIGDLATQVINRAVNMLRLARPVSVFGVRELSGMSIGDIRAMFNDDRVANAVIEQLRILRDDPNAQGRYIGFANAHFILVDNRSGNQLQTALTAAHELGHALLEEERNNTLSNKALYRRLQRAFQQARSKPDAPSAYQGELGFEEWYADQVANWAQKLYLNQKSKASNVTAAHFKKIAQKIKAMYDQLSSDFRKRFGRQNTAPEFDSYMDAVVISARKNRQASYQQSAARQATYEQDVLVRAINDATAQSSRAVAAAQEYARIVRRAINQPGALRDSLKFIRTADGVLRSISPAIADMFYVKAQARNRGGRLGFIRGRDNARRRLQNKLEDVVGSNWSDPQVVAAFEQAADTNVATADLTGMPKAIRLFLEDVYNNYIEPSPGNTIRRIENYFPVALDLNKIYADPAGFVETIIANDPTADAQAVYKAVDGLVAVQQYILDDRPITVDPLNPSPEIEAARRLTANLSPSDLADYTLPPTEAMLKYVDHVVKRVEWNRETKDASGNDVLQPFLDGLSYEDRTRAVEIIKTYLGYNTSPISPMFRSINSWGQFLQYVTILPFATIASLPEFAGAVVNGKEFGAVTMAMKSIVSTALNRQESMELARDIGVSATAAMSNVFMSDAEAEFMSPAVRKLSDAYFKVIGLDFFTRFTREFAANMGVSFVLTHAHNLANNPRSARYLRDLGLTSSEVLAWEADGRKFNTDAGRKVQQALAKFVESSMLRPNAAERPIWASDPRFALIWQLKGFLYSFGTVILGGIKREAGARIAEGTSPLGALGGVGALLALAAVAYLPLAMLSMELRERAKYLLAYALPGVEASDRYFRTDKMDWGTYFTSALQTAYGPMTIAAMMSQNANWGGSMLTPLFGPTAETIETVMKDGWRAVPDRLLPLYSVVY